MRITHACNGTSKKAWRLTSETWHGLHNMLQECAFLNYKSYVETSHMSWSFFLSVYYWSLFGSPLYETNIIVDTFLKTAFFSTITKNDFVWYIISTVIYQFVLETFLGTYIFLSIPLEKSMNAIWALFFF